MKTTRLERIQGVPRRHERFPDHLLFDEVGFRQESAEAAAEAFGDENFEECLYGRITHPNTNALAQVFCEMEGGEDAIVVASGMAATTTVALALCQTGDSIVSSSRIYGGTYELFHDFLPARAGIDTTFIAEPQNLLAWEEALAIYPYFRIPRFLFLETPGNPLLGVYDIEAIANLAHSYGTKLVVDNTMGMGIQRPIEFGADVSLSSLTKVASRGKKTGGVVIGTSEFISRCLAVRKLTGCAMDQNAAHWLMRPARTTSQRMKRHSRNALLLARILLGRGYAVHYPGFGNEKEKMLVDKQMGGHGGNLLSFEVKKGGRPQAMRLLNMLHEKAGIDIVTHFGEERVTMAVHPASTTHSRVAERARLSAGITEQLIRVSVDATRDFPTGTLLLIAQTLDQFEKETNIS